MKKEYKPWEGYFIDNDNHVVLVNVVKEIRNYYLCEYKDNCSYGLVTKSKNIIHKMKGKK